MDFNRGFAGSNFGGDLLVGKARDYKRQHLSLPRGQPFIALPQCGNFRLLLASFLVELEGGVNRVQEILIVPWLFQELDGSRLHGPDGHWNVSVPANKDNRNGIVGLSQLALEI